MKHGTTYKVLDDLRESLVPEIANASMTQDYLKKLYNKTSKENVTVDDILNPKETWSNSDLYNKAAEELATKFNENISKFEVSDEIRNSGPVL